MPELILVRHGEAVCGGGGYYGWTDAGLSGAGIAQAQGAAARLSGEAVTSVFSSPLVRALDTADIIAERLGLEAVPEEALKERNFGVWEGLSYDEIKRAYPGECEKWDADIYNYEIKNGESASRAYDRVARFIDALAEAGGGGKYVLVTHLGPIRVILAHLLGLGQEGIWRFRADCGSVSRLSVDERGYAFLTAFNIY